MDEGDMHSVRRKSEHISNAENLMSSFFHSAIDRMPVSLMITDTNLKLLFYNRHSRAVSLLPDGLENKTLFEVFDLEGISDLASFNVHVSKNNELFATARTPDGRKFAMSIVDLQQDGYMFQLHKQISDTEHLNNFIKLTFGINRELLLSILNTSTNPFCVYDPEAKLPVISNEAYDQLLSSLVQNESLENNPFLVDQTLPYGIYIQTGEHLQIPFVEEHQYVTKDGRKLIYEVSGYPVYYREARRNYVIARFNDITRLRSTEQSLQDLNRTFTEFFALLPGMVFRCLNETNFTFEFASAGCKAITGYSASDLVNNNKIHFGDLIHPDDKQSVWDNVQTALKRFRPYDLKYRIITRNGKTKWISERGRAQYDNKRNVVKLEGYLTDITGWKTSEIHLKHELAVNQAIADISLKLLQDSATPIDISMYIQQKVNEIAASAFTLIYAPDENGKSYTLFDHSTDEITITVTPDDYKEDQFDFLKQLIGSDDAFVADKPSMVMLPGYSESPVLLDHLISIPAFTNNKLSGLLVIVNADAARTDEIISAGKKFINMFALGLYRLKAEETLQEAKFKAEESDRLKSLFLSNMSHEIRTPMNAIVGFAELLKEGDLSREQQNRFLEVIIKSGDNLLRLINDIIDISKIEAGQLKLDYSDSLVNEMITDLQTFFKHELVRLKKGHLTLYTQLGHPDSDFTLHTDGMRLKQILNNLIGNAIKFTDEGFIEFGYHIKSGNIEFFVRDSGIGIPPEKQKIIFERFGQVQETISRNQTGTGLGLTISKNLVEMLGGDMRVESFPGEGSTFYFTLPLHLGSRTKAAAVAAVTEAKKGALDLSGKTILVVEDVDTNYMYMSSLLSKMNCAILRAANGKKAVELCRSNSNIDLVLMDIELPLMNGYEATTAIKEFRPELPIIAQTAFAMMGERERSIEAGCDDYLAKPIRKEELLPVLRRYLG